jgi:rare lipoprotein A
MMVSRFTGSLLFLAAIAQGCSALSRGSTPMTESLGPVPEVTHLAPFEPLEQRFIPDTKPVYVGKASWYGPGFVGRKTASGEVFDDAKLTAAHRSLPLGSKAEVTHLENGKSVRVEINDRGPFSQDRIIDLSRAAARALGMIDEGVARVRVEPVP